MSSPSSPTTCRQCGAPLGRMTLEPLCQRCMGAAAGMPPEPPNAEVLALFPEFVFEGSLGWRLAGGTLKGHDRLLQDGIVLKLLKTSEGPAGGRLKVAAASEKAFAHLDHPGLARVRATGERGGWWFCLTEFVDGVDATALAMRHGRLPAAEACEIVRQAALALHYGHQRGFLHGHLKPSSLRLSRKSGGSTDAVKILGLGAMPPGSPARRIESSEFSAPEVKAGAEVSVQSDIYALGALLRFLLNGPGDDDSPIGAVPHARSSIRNGGIHSSLVRICQRMTAETPSGCPASASEVASLLVPWAKNAELSRLFLEGPHAEKPAPSFWALHPRRCLLAAIALPVIAAALFFLRSQEAPASRREPSQSPSAVFSDRTLVIRGLLPEFAPRLLTDEWERDFEIPEAHPVSSARFRPDGSVLYLRTDARSGEVTIQQRTDDGSVVPFVSLGIRRDVVALAVDPTGGSVLWSQWQDSMGLHIGRADVTGNMLPPLRYDFASAPIFQGLYEALRSNLIKQGLGVPDGMPMGLATVTPGGLPNRTDLAAGDVLIAEEGHRNLAVQISEPGLWRCRADSSAPADRLASLPVEGNYPVDVAACESGVFLLNRSATVQRAAEGEEANFRNRILRWDRHGFHPCRLTRPLQDPAGLAADPVSGDLYVTQGASSAVLGMQRLVRLHPTGDDTFDLTCVADRFGRLEPCSIALSADGSRMLLTDSGNRVIVCLKRRPH